MNNICVNCKEVYKDRPQRCHECGGQTFELTHAEPKAKPPLSREQLIGTAFEYANISMRAIRISNEIQELITYLTMYKVPSEDIGNLMGTQDMLKRYHYSYTQSSLNKQIETNQL